MLFRLHDASVRHPVSCLFKLLGFLSRISEIENRFVLYDAVIPQIKLSLKEILCFEFILSLCKLYCNCFLFIFYETIFIYQNTKSAGLNHLQTGRLLLFLFLFVQKLRLGALYIIHILIVPVNCLRILPGLTQVLAFLPETILYQCLIARFLSLNGYA